MAKFALFVSAVSGRLASRPGNPFAYIGARLTTPAERKAAEEAGEEPVPAIWDEKQVVAITQREYLAHPLDWTNLIRNGDVHERTEKDFAAYTKALAQFEKKRDEQLAEEARRTAEAATAPAAGDLPPFDGSAEHLADGTGTENTPVEAPADGSTHELVSEGPRRKRGNS